MSTSPTSAIDAAIEALDDDFNVFSARRNPPDDDALATIEAALERPLPAAHRAFMRTWGCMAIIAKESVWPPPVAYEIRPRWQMSYGLEIFGAAPAGHQLSIITAREALRARGLAPTLLPLAKQIGAFAYLCADGDALVWLAGPLDVDREPVDDYETELLRLVAQLVRDKDRIKAEGVQRS